MHGFGQFCAHLHLSFAPSIILHQTSCVVILWQQTDLSSFIVLWVVTLLLFPPCIWRSWVYNVYLQSLCDFFPPSGTLLDLSVLRYSVPEWLIFPWSMWGVVFTACVIFFSFSFSCTQVIISREIPDTLIVYALVVLTWPALLSHKLIHREIVGCTQGRLMLCTLCSPTQHTQTHTHLNTHTQRHTHTQTHTHTHTHACTQRGCLVWYVS